MEYRRGRKKTSHRKAGPIRTTIMELLHVLSDLTKDDQLVLSAFKNIFDSHKVRLACSPIPVRLVGGKTASRTSTSTGETREKRHAAWA